jgi:YD repeat-containing protein
LVNEIYNSTAGAAITEGEGQTAWADPGHDAPGNMTGVPKPSDMTGQYTCVYDAWNRLAEVRDGQSTVAAYRYDGLNRRIRKAVASPSAAYDYYYNAAWQALEVRKDGASLPHEQYVWSPRYIDAPILRDRNADPNASTGDLGKAGSGLDERLYYLTDAQMNVTCLVDTAGDADPVSPENLRADGARWCRKFRTVTYFRHRKTGLKIGDCPEFVRGGFALGACLRVSIGCLDLEGAICAWRIRAGRVSTRVYWMPGSRRGGGLCSSHILAPRARR